MSGFEPWGQAMCSVRGYERLSPRGLPSTRSRPSSSSARSRGYSWRKLGEDLGLSAHGVRKRHLAVDPIYAWRSQRDPWLEAMPDKGESGG
jgi:hypothetical protein